jgi:hypothetical protein
MRPDGLDRRQVRDRQSLPSACRTGPDPASTALTHAAKTAGNLDWDVHYVDGTTVRAHQHAAGAKKATP